MRRHAAAGRPRPAPATCRPVAPRPRAAGCRYGPTTARPAARQPAPPARWCPQHGRSPAGLQPAPACRQTPPSCPGGPTTARHRRAASGTTTNLPPSAPDPCRTSGPWHAWRHPAPPTAHGPGAPAPRHPPRQTAGCSAHPARKGCPTACADRQRHAGAGWHAAPAPTGPEPETPDRRTAGRLRRGTDGAGVRREERWGCAWGLLVKWLRWAQSPGRSQPHGPKVATDATRPTIGIHF